MGSVMTWRIFPMQPSMSTAPLVLGMWCTGRGTHTRTACPSASGASPPASPAARAVGLRRGPRIAERPNMAMPPGADWPGSKTPTSETSTRRRSLLGYTFFTRSSPTSSANFRYPCFCPLSHSPRGPGVASCSTGRSETWSRNWPPSRTSPNTTLVAFRSELGHSVMPNSGVASSLGWVSSPRRSCRRPLTSTARAAISEGKISPWYWSAVLPARVVVFRAPMRPPSTNSPGNRRKNMDWEKLGLFDVEYFKNLATLRGAALPYSPKTTVPK
mmetsp:Transcript_1195/g.2415  ORF Transcript_1195/g.2415 Transcript_1195/m.2415 type:complete len:272 (-) Transcript_1195:680-1495(-)